VLFRSLIEPLSGGTPLSIETTQLQGASADHSHLLFTPGITVDQIRPFYLPGDPVTKGTDAGTQNAYVAHLDFAGEPTLELLARDQVGPDAGKAWGGTCGSLLGGLATARGAVSADGRHSFISARPTQAASGFCSTANKLRILARTETPIGTQIEELISDECDRVSPPCKSEAELNGDDTYLGASQDQNRVYFATPRQLADTDLDTTSDVYVYDSTKSAGERLTQVTAGGVGDATPGSGATVSSLLALSGDGSHAYFTSNAVLTTAKNPENKEAEAGKPNLYLYQYPTGTTSFVGTLAAAGNEGAYPVPLVGSNPAIGGDGHILLFNTKASLTANDSDSGFRDVFRYDDAGSSLACISCKPGGPDNAPFDTAVRSGPPATGTDFAEVDRWASEDGDTVALSTAEGLVPGDVNSVFDSYLWRGGQLYRLPGTAFPGGNPVLSHDGEEVAFPSFERLLPSDRDFAQDVYVARVEGGFPFPVASPPCQGEACQEPFGSPPATSSSGSERQIAGNVTPAPKPCGKHKVRRRGRCVRKPRHHRNKHHSGQKRHANTHRRAAK